MYKRRLHIRSLTKGAFISAFNSQTKVPTAPELVAVKFPSSYFMVPPHQPLRHCRRPRCHLQAPETKFSAVPLRRGCASPLRKTNCRSRLLRRNSTKTMPPVQLPAIHIVRDAIRSSIVKTLCLLLVITIV